MKEFNEREIWEKLKTLLSESAIPSRRFLEVPLPVLGYLLWGEAGERLKYKNHILSHILRKHRIRIIRKHGVRHALIPADVFEKKGKESRVEVSVVRGWRFKE